MKFKSFAIALSLFSIVVLLATPLTFAQDEPNLNSSERSIKINNPIERESAAPSMEQMIEKRTVRVDTVVAPGTGAAQTFAPRYYSGFGVQVTQNVVVSHVSLAYNDISTAVNGSTANVIAKDKKLGLVAFGNHSSRTEFVEMAELHQNEPIVVAVGNKFVEGHALALHDGDVVTDITSLHGTNYGGAGVYNLRGQLVGIASGTFAYLKENKKEVDKIVGMAVIPASKLKVFFADAKHTKVKYKGKKLSINEMKPDPENYGKFKDKSVPDPEAPRMEKKKGGLFGWLKRIFT